MGCVWEPSQEGIQFSPVCRDSESGDGCFSIRGGSLGCPALDCWCRGQDSNLRSTTHWDLIPAPLTARVPLLLLVRGHYGIFQRYPACQRTRYAIGTMGNRYERQLRKVLHNPPSLPSGMLSATAAPNSSINSAPPVGNAIT